MLLEEGVCYDQCVLLAELYYPCPVSFCTPRPNLPVTPGVLDFPGGSDGKASVYNVGDPGSSPGLERFPGEGNGNPLQYYCLDNPMDKGAW